MRYERYSGFLYGIVAAALERRNEYHVGLGSHYQLGVEVAFLANLHYVALLNACLYVFVEQVFRARDAFYHVASINSREV